jgi:ABC-type cobalamin/Fe3+-siderophores transport system ATPase subunit
MRLDRVYIDGFKNLKEAIVDFDERRLTTVLIGQNGSGKSNLIEAIAAVFRAVDLRRNAPRFLYKIDYRIGGTKVCLSNLPSDVAITVDGRQVSQAEFSRRKSEWFPDLVFGYYSGGSRRLEALFDSHQRRYYDEIKRNDDEVACAKALTDRRLFYCRPIHGVLALLSFFAFPDDVISAELCDRLGIAAFHSALVLCREPWFAKGGTRRKAELAGDFWGAAGPAGRTARALKAAAFRPMALIGNSIDDYRDKQQSESQYATFLPHIDELTELSRSFGGDREMFFALEAMDISDLIREVYLWVVRTNDTSGDVGFADLSDGERQLLMVLGLIRVSRGKRALFLLDEPDTHLNPHWQHGYLKLIEKWAGVSADSNNCHIVLTSHNPLTVSALTKDEVRIVSVGASGNITIAPPYTDPRGMGFTSTLTEVFGLSTSLDTETQRLIDERNTLAQTNERTKEQDRILIELDDRLNRLGFMFEDREPLYHQFLQAWKDVRYAKRPPMTPDQVEARRVAMRALIEELSRKRAS